MDAAAALLKASPIFGPIIVGLAIAVIFLWRANERKAGELVTSEADKLKMEQDFRKESEGSAEDRLKDVLDMNEKYRTLATGVETSMKMLQQTVDRLDRGGSGR